jgi:hypothetical protein
MSETYASGADIVEVVLAWGQGGNGSVLATKYLRPGDVFAVGEADGCDAVIPRDVLGAPRVDVVACDAMGARVHPPAGARAWVDGIPVPLEPIDLPSGRTVDVALGAFTVRTRMVPDENVATSWVDGVKAADFGGYAASALVHASLFAALALFLPPLGATDDDAIGRDQMLTMRHLLDASAMREEQAQEAQNAEPAADAEDHGASGGGRALGSEGKMGTEHAPENAGHWSAAGDAPRELQSLSRQEKQALVREFSGMVGLLASLQSDPNAPTVPWGEVLNGADRASHLGGLFGPEAADSWGLGGLGLSGTGEGGGGNNLGIGINDIGGLSASLDRRLGSNDAGGFGHGCGGGPCGVRGSHTPQGPRIRPPTSLVTNGRLPAEVIQRIVRQNMGRFRNCYESGLRTDPALEGRVAVRFVIDRTGQVSVAQDSGSDLPNDGVKSCIVKSFYSLSFPTPDNGTVTVTYPIALSPSQ